MKTQILTVTYNGMGGHPVLSSAGDFLLLDAPESFGSAIDEVEIYAHLQSSGRPTRSLENSVSGLTKESRRCRWSGSDGRNASLRSRT